MPSRMPSIVKILTVLAWLGMAALIAWWLLA